jgi:hypothetical protein
MLTLFSPGSLERFGEAPKKLSDREENMVENLDYVDITNSRFSVLVKIEMTLIE